MAIVAALESGADNILIVCPSAVKINWEREIHYFQQYDTNIIYSKKWQQAKFTIINYDILKNFHQIPDKKKEIIINNQHLVNGKFDVCIIDEAHFLKDHKSKRGSIMVDLCVNHGIEKVWLLTGTPIANRPMDYYNLLKLIKAPIADNWKFYAQRYCDAKRFFVTLKSGFKKQVWATKGASNLEELSIKTRNLVLRRKKEDVLDMPDKVITPTFHELNTKQWKEYDNLWEEYLVERAKNEKKGAGNRDLVELGLLRKFIAMEAIPETIQMAENALNQDQKIIIFTNFTDELLTLKEKFKDKAVIHYGEMTDEQKQRSVDEFQNNDKVRVFIGNTRSAGVGITLTAANIVIFNSFSWVPGENEQAEDRAYRIGQELNVSVYYQLFKDTISIRMWNTLMEKKDIIATIIGEKEFDDEQVIELMMDELLKENG